MFTVNKEPRNIKKVIIFLCLMPLVMSIVVIYYMWRLENVLYETVQHSMHEVGAHAASVAEESLQKTMAQIKSAADNPILRDKQANKAEVFRYLREVMKRNGWYDILMVDIKGQAVSVNGLRINIEQRPYFQKALAGVANTSALIEKSDYASYVLAHSAPVLGVDGKVVQVLLAYEEVSAPGFLHGITQEANMDGELIFVDKRGGWIQRGTVSTQSFWKKLFTENNLAAVSDMPGFIESRERSKQPLLLDGQKSFITVDKIGQSGWMVLDVVPSRLVTHKVDTVLYASLVFVLCMLIALGFCMFYLFRVGKAYTRYKNFSTAVANTQGIFYFYVDDQGFVHSANTYFYKQLGLEIEPESLQLFDYVDELSLEQLQDFLQGRTPFVLTIVPKEGHVFHLQCTVMPHMREGKMHLLLGTDITVYKADREMELIKTQYGELQQIINALPNSLMVHAHEGLRLVNQAALDVLGVKSIEEMRLGILCGMDAETYAKQVQMVESVLTEGVTRTSSFSFVSPTGQEFVFQNIQTPVFADDGSVKYAVNLCIDITATLRLQRQLEGEVQRLHEILDSSPSGFYYSYEQNVQYTNPTMQELLGLEVGQSLPVEKLNIKEEARQIRESVDNGINVYNLPVNILDIHGHERNLMVTALGTTWYGKWYTMVWAHDVTVIHKVQNELIQARDAAEAAARAKSDFLATMSHEIRTPMNAVLGFLQVFDKTNLHKTQLDYIEKITISAKGLLRIINDILDFSKIEANKMDLENVPFNLISNIDAVYSIMAFSAQEKGLSFTRSVDTNVPAHIKGDGERLNQVLLNLLSNAIKFTEKGSITLHVGIQEQSDAENFVLECSVSDTGIGLSQEQSSNLFKPFTQADTSTSRRFGGTGLGLVISQRIIELMGGRIELKSTLGEGSTFICTIPVQVPSPEEVKNMHAGQQILDESVLQAQEQSISEGEGIACQLESLRGKSVLVAEDNLINQEIAAAMLEEYDLNLDFANNGEEAVAAVQKKHYDLIFMDLQMPIMSGLDATKNIRLLGESIPHLKNIPIIAMTANVMHEDRRSCEEVGMNDHVGKPIDTDMLRRALLTWLADKV